MSDVSIVSGKLAVVGPSSNKPDGSEYTYLRITQKDGSTQLVKKVGVGHLVESHIRPGLEGDFYFVKLGRMGQILFAVKSSEGEKIYEQDGFATWIKKMRWSAAVLALLFIPLSFIALLMGGFFGIVVPVGFVYIIWKLTVSFPRVLKESFLRSHLTQYGFGS
ncbi:hypothetical protein ACIPM0_15700 [Pseudomonas sichuanensis]|uniref:hypothetical protein n=1 Tax=Pseudomonas sichuanensis TaxID=2213015 RepID=UPI0037FA7BFA